MKLTKPVDLLTGWQKIFFLFHFKLVVCVSLCVHQWKQPTPTDQNSTTSHLSTTIPFPHSIKTKVKGKPITASFAYSSPSHSLHHHNLSVGTRFHSRFVPLFNRYLHSSPQWGLAQLSVAASALLPPPQPQLITAHEAVWMKSYKLLQATASNPPLTMLLQAEAKSAK